MKRNITVYSHDKRTTDIANVAAREIRACYHTKKNDYIRYYSEDSMVKYEVTITVTKVMKTGDIP
jgi:hypothetical protein